MKNKESSYEQIDHNEKKSSPKRNRVQVAVAGATLALLLAAGGGCSGNASPEPTKTTIEDEQPDTEETLTTLSESEAQYAEYCKTLAEEQKRINESLNPDLLAEMTDAEITEAFKIRFEEVATDGKIDPEKYAKSYAIRFENLHSAGASPIEYDKWGGFDYVGSGSEIVDKYEQVIIDGIGGKDKFRKGNNSYIIALNRSVIIDSLNYRKDIEPKLERYKLRIMVVDGSVQSTINANGSLDITFDCLSIDNWNNEIMDEHTYNKLSPINQTTTLSITELHITDEGIVLPENSSSN